MRIPMRCSLSCGGTVPLRRAIETQAWPASTAETCANSPPLAHAVFDEDHQRLENERTGGRTD